MKTVCHGCERHYTVCGKLAKKYFRGMRFYKRFCKDCISFLEGFELTLGEGEKFNIFNKRIYTNRGRIIPLKR